MRCYHFFTKYYIFCLIERMHSKIHEDLTLRLGCELRNENEWSWSMPKRGSPYMETLLEKKVVKLVRCYVKTYVIKSIWVFDFLCWCYYPFFPNVFKLVMGASFGWLANCVFGVLILSNL